MHYKVSIFAILLYIISILLTTYLLFLLNHFVVCVSFWIEKSSSIQGIPEYLTEFASRSLTIYPNVVRFIFTWVVPILVGVNLPVLIIKGEQWGMYVIAIVIFNIIGTIFAKIIWEKGIRRYVSAN